MNFPKLVDIATKQVITINDSKTIQEAVEVMYKSNHRDIIIVSEEKRNFGILKANDLVKLKQQNIDFNTKLRDIKYDFVMAIHYCSTIPDAIDEINSNCNCICLVDDEGRLCGYVSYYDIISSIDPKIMLEKRTLSDILISSYIKEAQADISAFEVIVLMDNSIYDSVVIFEGDKGVGIVTTKDIVKLFGENKDLALPIRNYMSSPLITVKHTTSIASALEFIQTQHFKRIVVEDHDGNIVGQITQEELIARVYARWADFMRNEKSQLTHVNKVLEAKASKFEQLASIDKLTSLHNRTKFEATIKDEISRVSRYETKTFSIAIFDVDNFKSINDNFGHLIGDIILKEIAAIAKKTIRVTDLICRWGGEEFVVIMPMTSLEHAVEASEKIRKAINAFIFDNVGCVSCSFGVAEYNPIEDNVQSIMTRADKAMYMAKRSGKNKVVSLKS
ncbi:diguanylate cyclase [Arcobacter sp. FWKO B]|uniref:diguanylate cyclase n=1 Tax=Arcobacter sp. FWKO B TaxID=2593672 RepID=UPI0018A3A704|nr:diguanylate cyclase [Arcobacter sp. FWKO B]QOG13146.1 diguanylate cyclase [Arcobacter sp. FWKO B]